MGGGGHSTDAYAAREAAKRAAGIDPFEHDQKQRQKPVDQRKVHDRLSPAAVAGPASPHAGQVMRECMITDEHPEPTPIAVLFDQTGSMGRIPRVLQTKLPALLGLLVRKGYASDPQIMFGAIGDANTGGPSNPVERAPLQVGQFESDNRLDEDLASIYLEGSGGGQVMETYDLGLYFLARHTYLEPFEKQGRKGYAFIIGDEGYYPEVLAANVKRLIGVSIESNVPTADIVREVEERYHLFFVFAKQGYYAEDKILGPVSPTRPGTWRDLLGERAIVLDDADAVCEVIGATVGLIEGSTTLDDALVDLKDVGSTDSAVAATGRALATIGASAEVVATSSGELPGMDD